MAFKKLTAEQWNELTFRCKCGRWIAERHIYHNTVNKKIIKMCPICKRNKKKNDRSIMNYGIYEYIRCSWCKKEIKEKIKKIGCESFCEECYNFIINLKEGE